MSEYLKKILIPKLSGGEDEITILSPDDVYTKDQIDGFNLTSVVKISQADYNRIDEYSAETLYVIPGKRIYLGNSLIWKKPVYNDNDLAGTWDEDSSSDQWGFLNGHAFINLEDVTDIETKEFIKDLSDYSGTTKSFEQFRVKRLYHVPKNGGISIRGNKYLISADFSGVKFGGAADLFWNCNRLKFLNLTDVDTSSFIQMYMLFNGCSSLKSLDLSSFDTSNVTNMNNMFYNCSSLESLDLSSFDTSSVTDMSRMFDSCSSLKSLDLSSFDISSVANVSYMFTGCNNLVNVVGPIRGIKVNLDLGDCTMLSQDSAMVFIEGLQTTTSNNTITFSQNTYDSLTPEQISIATSKGWTVIRSY